MSKIYKTTNQIRDTYIDYFKNQGHQEVKSSNLIPDNDPSLMFTNSGMVQFKNIFTGSETREYTKAVSSQKCIRAGGKHNDLDNVGYTSRHHTFFEMLGNFSFGDYFKEEAIYYAWELLTKIYQIPKEKLYITVYHTDEEAIQLWKKIASLSDERLIKISTNDNFWSMGDTGPCGPCSEIFYDHGDKIWGGLPGTKEEDGDRFVEIWNLVFMQYEQLKDGSRVNLPKQSIDTGMGLERISAVLQNVHDNYHTDSFKEIIAFTEDLIKTKATGDALFSYRVIADHMRASAFLIADSGIIPSNEGRGYVLRRIMRRAMRHIHMLGSKEETMHKITPKIVELFGGFFKEITEHQNLISNILYEEEVKFRKTLGKGLKILQDEVKHLTDNGNFPGEAAFKLYDTYGFPLDLTQDILRSQKISIDIDAFNQEMQKQKERARQNWSGSGDNNINKIWFEIAKKINFTEFLGYTHYKLESNIECIIQDNILVDKVTYTESEPGSDKSSNEIKNKANKFILITNQTPFYGESGGQMGDIGYIQGISSNFKIKVTNTKKIFNKIIFHICEIEHGTISSYDKCQMIIDKEYRNGLKKHHSATHLLHSALRNILGKNVMQKGSLVSHNKLRFDFSHNKQVSQDELLQVEKQVNEIIFTNNSVDTTIMDAKEAIDAGATALFGEKYDEKVRVVNIKSQNKNDSYSMELCGGTHVNQLGDIGLFKIISEGSVASGVRRIEATCAMNALNFMQQNDDILYKLNAFFKTNNNNLFDKITLLTEKNKSLEKELVNLKLKEFILNKEQINNIVDNKNNEIIINDDKLSIYYKEINNDNKNGQFDISILRNAINQNIKTYNDIIYIYHISNKQQDNQENKQIKNNLINNNLIIGVSHNLIKTISAKDIGNKIMKKVNGKGGGNDLSVQINFSDVNNLSFNEIKNIIIVN